MASSAANSDSEFDLAIDEEPPPKKAEEEKDIFETDLDLDLDLGVPRAVPGEALTAMPQIASDEIVTVNLVVNCMGHAFAGVTLFKVIFDNESLYRPAADGQFWWDLREGCDLSFTTTQGDHILQVAYGGFLGVIGARGSADGWKPKNTKTYTVSFREGGGYRITLQAKSGFLSMNPSFADEVQQTRSCLTRVDTHGFTGKPTARNK
jgi:hypothetical protein